MPKSRRDGILSFLWEGSEPQPGLPDVAVSKNVLSFVNKDKRMGGDQLRVLQMAGDKLEIHNFGKGLLLYVYLLFDY